MAKHIAFSSRASGRCEELLGAPSHTCTGKPSSFPVTQEMRCQTIPCGRQMRWETKAICTFRSVGNCLVYPCAFPVVSDLPSPSLCGFWFSLHTLSHPDLPLSFPPFPALLCIIMMELLTFGDHSVGQALIISFLMCEKTSLASGRCTAPICLSRRFMRNRQDY